VGFVDDEQPAPGAGTGGGRFVDAPVPTRPRGRFTDDAPAQTPIAASSPTPRVGAAPRPYSDLGAQRPASNPLETVNRAVLQGQVNAWEAIKHPLDALNAVAGAPERFLAGAATYQFQPQATQRAPLDPRGVTDSLAYGADMATHPFNTAKQNKLTQDTLHLLGFDDAENAYDAVVNKGEQLVGKTPVIGRAAVSTGEASKGAVRLMSVLAAQTMVDPLTHGAALRTVVDAAKSSAVLQRAAQGVQRALQAIPGSDQATSAAGKVRDGVFAPASKAAQTVGRAALARGKWIFGRRPELDEHLNDTGKAGRLGIEQKIQSRVGDGWRDADDALIEKNAPAIKAAKANAEAHPDVDPYPPALRQRLNENAWRFGTADMRNALEAEGYRPGAADFDALKKLGLGPEPPGILNFNIVSKYRPGIRGQTDFAQQYERTLKSLDKRYAGGKASFEHVRKSEGDGFKDDPIAVMQRRLALERYVVQRRLVDNETEKFLTDHGGWIGTGAIDAAKLSHEASPFAFGTATGKAVDLGDAGRGLGRLGAQAVKANPLPHALRNVGELAFLAGGPEAFGAGVAHAARGLTDEAINRLTNTGLTVNYATKMRGPLEAAGDVLKAKGGKAGRAVVAGAEQYGKGSQAVLDRLEMGFRYALLQHYDNVLGASKTLADEYKKADLVRRDLGDYRNVSLFVKGLQAIGGPFVAFRIGTVPSAVGRALKNNPERVRQLTAPQVEAAQDPRLEGKKPYETVLGGPAEDFARASFDGPDYLGSPSTIGPLGGAFQEYERLKAGHAEPGASIAGQIGEAYIPGASIVEGLFGQPYGSTPGVSPLHEALLQAFGAYAKRRGSVKSREQTVRQMERGR
jgi:hypothetical protein